AFIRRDTTSISSAATNAYTAASTDTIMHTHQLVYDKPNAAGTFTYKVSGQNVSTGSGLVNYQAWNMTVQEIMG
ncbi:MAG TPA: hypothetical protein VH593_10445, partial [Ktedonobacteraceae bacterium]